MKFEKYIDKSEEIFVIDFQKRPESVLNKIIKKHKAKVTDWVKKDYGLLLFIDVPNDTKQQFKHEVKNTKGYDIT